MAILLVEDDTLDARFFIDHLKRLNSELEVHWVQDGEEALNYLLRKNQYCTASRPTLVVLDLGLPRVNGHQVIERYATESRAPSAPIVVLSTSDRAEDESQALNIGVAAYFVKPLSINDYEDIVAKILAFQSTEASG